MTALSFSSTQRSRTRTISAFCWAVDSPWRDGQSMLATVATQTPRNSRRGAGGISSAAGEGGQRVRIVPSHSHLLIEATPDLGRATCRGRIGEVDTKTTASLREG